MKSPLGEFEVVVLMAVLQLGAAANGSAVRDEIERRTKRKASRGSVYVTLDRLEEKGLLTSQVREAPTVRGGTTRLFRVSATGVKAVKHSVDTLASMKAGLELFLEQSK